MTPQARRHLNDLKLAVPLLDSEENVEGWYCFEDEYLSPEVKYSAFPPTTHVKIGGRTIEIDRATPLKIRLLEVEEDYHFWCRKKQHSKRINCGEFHKDFGDVEVGYSFSSPQTHIWFAGYAIHADCFENLFFSSARATVRVTPEHVLPPPNMASIHGGRQIGGHVAGPSGTKMLASTPAPSLPTRSLFEMVVDEGADFPVYHTTVPRLVETYKGYRTELTSTPEFVNDCERDIIQRDVWDAGVAVSQISQPVSYPPTYPPVQPFEHAGLFWSYVYNELLKKRCARDEMENAIRDMAILRRYQQYEHDARQKDRRYYRSLDRLSDLLTRKKVFHDIVWPVTDAKCEGCKCQICRHGRRPVSGYPSDMTAITAMGEGKSRHHRHRHHHRPALYVETPGDEFSSSQEDNWQRTDYPQQYYSTGKTRYVLSNHQSRRPNVHQVNQAWDALSRLGETEKRNRDTSSRRTTGIREYWPQSYFAPVT